MCGRYVVAFDPETLVAGFSLLRVVPFPRRWNVAPTSTVPVVYETRDGERVAEAMRWGLVPHWARDASIGARLVNARGETVAEKPAFRQALRRSRCLIPANGFYEWRAPAAGSRGRKQPFYIHARDGGLIAMAALFERWQGPEGPLATCCIVTTEANPLMAPIHDRMPVLLDRPGQSAWLDPAQRDPQALAPLLQPCPDDWLALHAVAPDVGDARREGATLIEPLTGLTQAGPE